jgi:hypothetical protein
VVGPAGGETGGPRCLAEVYKLLKAAYLPYFISKNNPKKVTPAGKSVKQKPKRAKKLSGGVISTPRLLSISIIPVMAVKCKFKIIAFSDFLATLFHLSGES